MEGGGRQISVSVIPMSEGFSHLSTGDTISECSKVSPLRHRIHWSLQTLLGLTSQMNAFSPTRIHQETCTCLRQKREIGLRKRDLVTRGHTVNRGFTQNGARLT